MWMNLATVSVPTARIDEKKRLKFHNLFFNESIRVECERFINWGAMKNPKSFILILFLLMSLSLSVAFSGNNPQKTLLERGKYLMETEGDLEGAIAVFGEIIKKYPKDRIVAAQAQLFIGLCYERMGRAEAKRAYQNVINNYSGSGEIVQIAQKRLLGLMPKSPPKRDQIYGLQTEFSRTKLKETESGIPFDAISPDGKFFTYVDWYTGDLAVFDRDTGERKRITDKGSWEKSAQMALFSTWAPDGKTIACVWIDEKPTLRELRLFPVDGSSPRILFSNPDLWVWDVKDWSRDGRKILVLFKKNEGETEIGIIDAESGQSRILKTLKKHLPVQMAFSPEGKFIAYDFKVDRTNSDIFIMSTEDGIEQKLIDHPSYDVLQGWSPDGKWLLFSSDRAGKIDFWALPVEGGEAVGPPVNIVEAPGSSLPMGFTLDGAFYYSDRNHNIDIFRADIDPSSGKKISEIINMGESYLGLNSQAVLSPDGAEVVFLTSRGPGLFEKKALFNTLGVINLKTGQQQECITNLDIPNFYPLRWSSRGRAVLFVANEASEDMRQISIYRFDIDGRDVLEFYEGNPDLSLELCSSDERFVIARRMDRESRINRIVRVDIESGDEEILYEDTLRPNSLSLSPDDRFLIYLMSIEETEGSGQQLHMIPMDGGKPRILMEEGGGVKYYSTGWMTDSGSVLLTKIISKGEGQISEVWNVPLNGGEPIKLGIDAVTPSFMSMDQQGCLVYTARTIMKMDVWKMSNFLPERK